MSGHTTMAKAPEEQLRDGEGAMYHHDSDEQVIQILSLVVISAWMKEDIGYGFKTMSLI